MSVLICFESIVKLFKEDFSIGCQASIQLKLFPCKHSARCTGRQSVVAFIGNEGSHEKQGLEPCLLLSYPLCSWGLLWNHLEELCSMLHSILYRNLEKCMIAELQTLLPSHTWQWVAPESCQHPSNVTIMKQKHRNSHCLIKTNYVSFRTEPKFCRCNQHLLISLYFFTFACIPLRTCYNTDQCDYKIIL